MEHSMSKLKKTQPLQSLMKSSYVSIQYAIQLLIGSENSETRDFFATAE
jgi:hypothetical protein